MEEKGKKPVVLENVVKKSIQVPSNFSKKSSGFKKEKVNYKWISILFFFILVIIGIIVWSSNKKTDIEIVKDSVVKINVYDEDNSLISTGSGFCIYEKNIIATNFHVIEGAYKLTITTDDNQNYSIDKILVFNKNEDIALIQGNFDLTPLKPGNIDNLKAGENITAIGSPKGELNTVSTGIISNADNSYEIRITAPISPGSSGGVLLNNKNQVIGLTYATYNSNDSQNLNYAISIKYLYNLYESFKNKNYSSLSSSNIENKTYNISSMKSFYNYTNDLIIFENKLSYDWKNIYNGFRKNDKQIIVELSKQIENKNYSFININEWEVIDYLINLKILNCQESAVVATDIYKNTTSSNVFKHIESYNLGTYEKAVILLLLGGYTPGDLNNIDADNVVKKVNELSLSIDEKGQILRYLGYIVDGDSVRWE